MANFAKTDTAPPPAENGTGERAAGAPFEPEVARGDAAIQGLPGVVNDLPEVAPHEWIYIMS